MWWWWWLACAEPVADPPDAGTFTLLTYNVQGLPAGLTDAGIPPEERMPQISPLLGAYDVVGVQEDFDETLHAQLVADAPHAGQWWFSEPLDASRVYGAGLGFLSDLPADAYATAYYSRCAGVFDGASDCLASKGFQRVSLRLGAGVVDVYNTHHEAGGGPDDDAARASQVAEVVADIAGRPDEHAVIVMGDTNLRPSDPEDAAALATYASIGLVDACDAVNCTESDHIDRFLVRGGSDLALAVDAWWRAEEFVDPSGADLSDHPAVGAQISWAAGAASTARIRPAGDAGTEIEKKQP
jgi:endonuclease/exonuclease/phosphatase family metal-dependent hydrolase